MTRSPAFTDEMWAAVEPLLPPEKGPMGRPYRDPRLVLEGIVFRYRTGCPWRDLPAEFGPWQTVWKRHARYTRDGVYDRVLTGVLSSADADGHLDWTVSVDSTIARVHQHGANGALLVDGVHVERSSIGPSSHTGGSIELQESAA